jgi:hypothetical protein
MSGWAAGRRGSVRGLGATILHLRGGASRRRVHVQFEGSLELLVAMKLVRIMVIALAVAPGLGAACSSPYEGGGRMPIPLPTDDTGDSGDPFEGLSPVDASAGDDAADSFASGPDDADFDVLSLFSEQ